MFLAVENVKCFKYLGSTLTDDGRCTCEIKSRIATAKAAFNKKKNIFKYQQIGLKFEEETSEMLRLEHGSVWLKLGRSGQRIRNAWKI